MQKLFKDLFGSDPVFPKILSARVWDSNGLPIADYVSPCISNDYSAGYALMKRAEAELVRAAYLDPSGENTGKIYKSPAVMVSTGCERALLTIRRAGRGYLTAYADADVTAKELYEFGDRMEKKISVKKMERR